MALIANKFNVALDFCSVFGDADEFSSNSLAASARDVDEIHSKSDLGCRAATTMMTRSGDGAPPLRVALCHLESLACLPAINRLFMQMGDEIGLVILSNRFGSRHGGHLRQFVTNVRRSGFRLTLWLGFDIVGAQVAGRVGRWIEALTRRRQRLASVRTLAERHGAAIMDVAAINSSDAIGVLRSYAPDVVLVMSFDQVLRQEFIAAAPAQVINVHPSLLPALRGPCPVFWALAEGRAEAGVSLHFIEDENIDAGAVLAQRTRPLDRARSVAEITTALFEEGAALMPEVVRALREGRTVGRPQDVEGASYRGFPDRADVARARRAGVRLCRFWQLAKLLLMAVGVAGCDDRHQFRSSLKCLQSQRRDVTASPGRATANSASRSGEPSRSEGS